MSEPAPIALSRYAGAAFDLDGVITDTASVHAQAWKHLFDAFLAEWSRNAGRTFVPFELEHDYSLHVDGKAREDGIRDFLASRGIALPGPALQALGVRKNAFFLDQLAKAGLRVFQDAVALIHALRAKGVRIAIVSASENTVAIVQQAHLASLFDARVDGITARHLRLKGKPAPDLFLEAARMLGVAPARMLGIEDAVAGVEAIRAAGYGLAVGVDRGGRAEQLAAHGAQLVVGDLGRVSSALVDGDADADADATTAHAPMPLPATPGTDPEWTVRETGFMLVREHEIESLLAIGNGYLGCRASLAEESALSFPATYVAGLYDHEPGKLPSLAIAPNWTHLAISIEDQPASMERGETLAHERVLDMRQGIAFRTWRHRDDAGRTCDIRELRLASMSDRHLLLQTVDLAPLNFGGRVRFDSNTQELSTRTTATGATLALAVATTLSLVEADNRRTLAPQATGSLAIEPGKRCLLERVACVHTSRDAADPSAAARAHVAQAAHEGVPAQVQRHVAAWRALWDRCDLVVAGDAGLQQALRFAIHHLLSAANPDDPGSSIGARGLTGSAYLGHVFWDTELYMLPFFTWTAPEIARKLLLYRHGTLPAARRRARAAGHAGALYAWESADTGDDVTPATVQPPDGPVIPILTGALEQHISADVAYAAWHYWHITGDDDFLLQAGAEILVETARFWASRTREGSDGLLHIEGVIGPDEYHEAVDDNAYTNGMARWNLRQAARIVRALDVRHPGPCRALQQQLALAPEEVADWEATADRIYDGMDPRTGLIEQFRGFFQLEDLHSQSFDRHAASMELLVGRERLQRSQIIKQADVVMLLHLLWDDYTPQVREANFRYYEPRCNHGSSLSPAIHALVAARLGDVGLARRYLRQAEEIDLADNMGNASGGVHLGAMGALWQAVAHGFAGLRAGGAGPVLAPQLAPEWRGIRMRVMYQGRPHELRASGPTEDPT